MKLRDSVLACSLLAGLVSAQPASITYYGSTCGPQAPSGSPRILVEGGLPKLGNTLGVSQRGVTVQVFPDCRWTGAELLVLGASRTQAFGVPLPILVPFALTQGYPCLLWTSSDLILPGVALSDGRPLTIPNDARLLGMHVYLQWFVYYRSDGNGPLCFPQFERWMASDCADLLIGT